MPRARSKSITWRKVSSYVSDRAAAEAAFKKNESRLRANYAEYINNMMDKTKGQVISFPDPKKYFINEVQEMIASGKTRTQALKEVFSSSAFENWEERTINDLTSQMKRFDAGGQSAYSKFREIVGKTTNLDPRYMEKVGPRQYLYNHPKTGRKALITFQKSPEVITVQEY